MLRIVFEYRDQYTNGRWNTQECICDSIRECVEWYGLGVDCEYRIISAKPVNEVEK